MVRETNARLAERVAKRVARRGRVCLRVQGTSMLPWLRPRDIVEVRGVRPETIRRGDLVLFARHSFLVTHRVIEKRDPAGVPRLVAKGDACRHSDGVIHNEELLGRVVCIHRGRRRIDLNTPWQAFKGNLIARVSGSRRSWYPAARAAAMIPSPVRRLLAFFL